MGEFRLSAATTTESTIKDYRVDPQTLDSTQAEQKEVWYDFPDASQQLGYYKSIPEFKRPLDTLGIWTVGKGLSTSVADQVSLDTVSGWGEDSFQSVVWNLLIQKKIFGDSFAEIVRDDEGNLLNLIPLYTGDMRIVVEKGIIKRYEQRTNGGKGKPIEFRPSMILHLCNDRIGNEIHGTSVLDACKWVIDARNEALNDERMIKHRDLAMGILYVDSDKPSKIAAVKDAYAEAVKKGEVLVLPKGTAELKDSNLSPRERIQWIQYLENFFYQILGVPKIIANAGDATEASSKVGYLAFEPIYISEQTLLESDLWKQLAIRVKYNRPASLGGIVQEDEQKNTGQTGIQPNEVQADIGRTE